MQHGALGVISQLEETNRGFERRP
mgnify:CR=1